MTFVEPFPGDLPRPGRLLLPAYECRRIINAEDQNQERLRQAGSSIPSCRLINLSSII